MSTAAPPATRAGGRRALAAVRGAYLVSAALFVLFAADVVSRPRGWTVGTCWLWNPLPLVLALQAMETSLLLFAVALALFVFVTRVLRPAPEPRAARRGAVLLGAALGLATWARTDMVVLAACAAAAVAWGTPAPGRATRPPTARRVVLGLLTLA